MTDTILTINQRLQIPRSELRYRYARSSGPGGQHVNRSETQVELLWDVVASPSLDEDQRARLLAALGHRIDKEGVMHLISAQTRSQERNRQDVTLRFVQLLRQALRPRIQRRRTRIPDHEKERRRQAKRHRGQIKRWRKGTWGDD